MKRRRTRRRTRKRPKRRPIDPPVDILVSKNLTIERLDPVTGHGVVFDGNDILTVPFTAPGDDVAVSNGAATLQAPTSDIRRTPPCPHFGECGGCQLQHIDDAALAGWKRGVVSDALARHDIEVTVAPTVTVPASARRRARFTLQRTKKTAPFGFRAAGEHRIVDMQTCAILTPSIIDALPHLRGIALAGAPRKRAVTLQVTQTDTGLDVMAEDMKEMDLPLQEILSAIAERADLARLVWNGELLLQRRRPALRFGPATVHPPPGAFLQAAREAEGIILDILRTAIGEAKTVADLFCGLGTFALPLAEKAFVTAIDSDAKMIAALDEGARTCPALRPVTAKAHDLFRNPLLPEDLARFDAVVIDPPRTGAKAQIDHLAASTVPVIAMVSCNPATFARDARTLLDGGYRAGPIVPIDQFRWSPHTEVVGIFRRA